MARVTLENVTTEYKGEQIAGRYLVDKGTVVVFYAGLRKATQVGDSPPESLARISLGELAAEYEAASKRK